MRTFAVLGLALICLSQVCCENGDLLRSLLIEKAKELKSEKLPEPEILSATETTTASDCDANAVVLNGTTLMKNTLDIVSETFSAAYTVMYPSSGSEKCTFTGTFGKFRCYLWQFNEVKNSIKDVDGIISNYQPNAKALIAGITAYVQHCL